MGLFRRLTDRLVRCEACGGPIGYVWLFGHKRWRHEDCAAAGRVVAA